MFNNKNILARAFSFSVLFQLLFFFRIYLIFIGLDIDLGEYPVAVESDQHLQFSLAGEFSYRPIHSCQRRPLHESLKHFSKSGAPK